MAVRKAAPRVRPTPGESMPDSTARGASEAAIRRMLRRGIQDGLREIGEAILAESQRRVPVGATAGLKDSGHIFPSQPIAEGDVVWLQVRYSAPHAAYVHEGTQPHWPPREALLRWVQLVLGVKDEDEARRVEYLVRRKIARFGTDPQPFLREAAEEVLPRSEAILNQAIARAMKGFEAELGGELRRRETDTTERGASDSE